MLFGMHLGMQGIAYVSPIYITIFLLFKRNRVVIVYNSYIVRNVNTQNTVISNNRFKKITLGKRLRELGIFGSFGMRYAGSKNFSKMQKSE